MNYWLMKSEPAQFSLTDLMQRPHKTEPWNGVRNYQARNFMRSMQLGDLAFFYHSNCKDIGIVGIMQIVKTAYADNTFINTDHQQVDYENPRWFMVDVQFVEQFSRTISLQELKQYPQLSDFQLVQRGNRLSIMPVNAAQWAFILTLLG